MWRYLRRRKPKGILPGERVSSNREEEKPERVRITLIHYDEKDILEKELDKIEEVFSLQNGRGVTWLNIDGIHQGDTIEKIGKHFNLHPLTLEDITSFEQRPKMEDFEDYIFFLINMFYYEENTEEVMIEQVSFILGQNFVISFQEREGDVFDAVRGRIRTGKGRIRRMGADYLAYALIDAIVDSYFVILEKMGEKVEVVEEEVVEEPTPETLQKIHYLKREMLFLRKSVWPWSYPVVLGVMGAIAVGMLIYFWKKRWL